MWCADLHDLAEEILVEGSDSDPMEKAFLQELRTNPQDEAHWSVYGDWLEERGRPRAELWLLQQALGRLGKRPIHRHLPEFVPEDTPNVSQWRVEPHVAQLCLHESTISWSGKVLTNCFDHWIIFDDLWASA